MVVFSWMQSNFAGLRLSDVQKIQIKERHKITVDCMRFRERFALL